MNLKTFFVATLSSALELGLATPDDVLRHVSPEVLAQNLPRPLWARLLTACWGAPRVDSQLVVETIGVANLCEHVPTANIWACIAELAQRSLGNGPLIREAPPIVTRASMTDTGRSRAVPLATPPPPPSASPSSTSADAMTLSRAMTPARGIGPHIPAPTAGSNGSAIPSIGDVVAELEAEDQPTPPTPGRTRTPTQNRFRQSNTGIGRLANNPRRPQAQATPPLAEPAARAPSTSARRGDTEGEVATDIRVDKEDWKSTLAVEDEQLVDWQSSEETMTSSEDFSKLKR